MSSSEADISITKIEECWLLFAHTVKLVGSKEVVGVPPIAPVLLLNPSPGGIAGPTSQVLTSPPNEVGLREMLEMLVTIVTDGYG